MKKKILFILAPYSIINCYGQPREAYFKKGIEKSELQDIQGVIPDSIKAIEIYTKYSAAYNSSGFAKGIPKNYQGANSSLIILTGRRKNRIIRLNYIKITSFFLLNK